MKENVHMQMDKFNFPLGDFACNRLCVNSGEEHFAGNYCMYLKIIKLFRRRRAFQRGGYVSRPKCPRTAQRMI